MATPKRLSVFFQRVLIFVCFILFQQKPSNLAFSCREPCSDARCTALSTHTTTWNTCCHNTAKLITMYFYWLFLQTCEFIQAQGKLPEDGPGGFKHVGANIRYFNVNFNIFICLIKCAFVGKREFWRFHKNSFSSNYKAHIVSISETLIYLRTFITFTSSFLITESRTILNKVVNNESPYVPMLQY